MVDHIPRAKLTNSAALKRAAVVTPSHTPAQHIHQCIAVDASPDPNTALTGERIFAESRREKDGAELGAESPKFREHSTSPRLKERYRGSRP